MTHTPAKGAALHPAQRDEVVEFDVVIASDLRFPGGTSHSIAEEVAAQYEAGYRTGLIHLNGPLVRRIRPINPLIRNQVRRGRAELVVGPTPVKTKLLVIRHPAIAQTALDQLPQIKAQQVIIVANAGPEDVDGTRHYSPDAASLQVVKHLGVKPTWAPIGPLVRDEVAGDLPSSQMLETDWVNIIDISAWDVPRSTWASDRPVVGRHSRPSRQKWPEQKSVLEQVYPTDGRWIIRVLGGAGPVEDLLGYIPEKWQVLPFGTISPKDFLADLDFFVYYHDSRWVEAFGRTILEAIASGLPAIVGSHFKPLFGDAALYAEPHEVAPLIERLYTDRTKYEEHVAAAREEIRANFGHEAHIARLTKLIGPPSRVAKEPTPQDVSPPKLSQGRMFHTTRVRGKRVLLMSSNGAGMGHLTRLLSYARRLETVAVPHFLSMSQAVPVVNRFGYSYEYVPSAKAISMAPGEWNRMFYDRVLETLDRIRPDAVVFDGTWPYNGIEGLRAVRDDIAWVWSRRGMWRKGLNREQIDKAAWFDLVIEPGDFAAPYDQGATVGETALRVKPVTLLDRSESHSKASAREALGLPPDRRYGLISLGAGNINDTTSDIAVVAAELSRLGLEVCLTRPEIAGNAYASQDLHIVQDYPLSRNYAAFDIVISASGYNSFQELLRMGVPSLFVPNHDTSLDDQAARARFAADRGWAMALNEVTPAPTRAALERLLQEGTSMAAGAVRSDLGNGAVEVARSIAGIIGSSNGDQS